MPWKRSFEETGRNWTKAYQGSGNWYGCFQNSGTPKSSILVGFSIWQFWLSMLNLRGPETGIKLGSSHWKQENKRTFINSWKRTIWIWLCVSSLGVLKVRGPPFSDRKLHGKIGTLKIDYGSVCPFSNFLWLFQVIMAHPEVCNHPS